MSGKNVSLTGVGIALVFGAVDASVLTEKPIERIETVAEERVMLRQVDNVIETTFPWKDAEPMIVKYDMGEPTLAERLADKRKKEVITETVTDFEGGFKVDIILNEKPDTNRFCYTIEGAENYDFFYQPPLTDEEKAQGSVRPPEIEGSYAVYHKTLKNHQLGGENYATGKVMHIPRPQVWSMSDTETKVWADMTYDESGLCVTVPQEFLNKAEYPVRVDPTFGYTTVGGSTVGMSPNRIQGSLFAEEPSITIMKTGYVYGNFQLSSVFYGLRGVIVASSTKTIISNGVSSPMRLSSDLGWQPFTFPATPSFPSGDSFFLSLSVSNTFIVYYDSGGDTLFDSTNNFFSPTDPTDAIKSTFLYSMYGEYCTSAGGCTLTEYFNATTTSPWTAPTGVTSADVACWGGGGGGADGGTSGASSGGGGAFASSTLSIIAGDTYYVTVGAGGAQTLAGGDSLFATAASSTLVLADNGTGGAGATANGLGGTTANSSGTVEFKGGDGHDGNGTQDVGAGGGGSAGPSGAGQNGEIGQAARGGGGGSENGGSTFYLNYGHAARINGATGSSTPLGGGGGGGAYNGGVGGGGGSPGGGGGGGEATGGADGAPGQCTITYTVSGGGGGGGDEYSPQDAVFWFD